MHRTAFPFVLCLFLGLAGCEGGIAGSGTCVAFGKTYKVGQTFPDPDGCNTCSCSKDGSVACTLRGCQSGDLLMSVDLANGADGGSDVVMCTGPMEPKFPSFNKTCRTAADCFVALHQINCCGTIRAYGYNLAEKPRFDKAEATCREQYPKCGCPTLPTMAEDGKISMNPDDIAVRCGGDSACTTYIR